MAMLKVMPIVLALIVALSFSLSTMQIGEARQIPEPTFQKNVVVDVEKGASVPITSKRFLLSRSSTNAGRTFKDGSLLTSNAESSFDSDDGSSRASSIITCSDSGECTSTSIASGSDPQGEHGSTMPNTTSPRHHNGTPTNDEASKDVPSVHKRSPRLSGTSPSAPTNDEATEDVPFVPKTRSSQARHSVPTNDEASEDVPSVPNTRSTRQSATSPHKGITQSAPTNDEAAEDEAAEDVSSTEDSALVEDAPPTQDDEDIFQDELEDGVGVEPEVDDTEDEIIFAPTPPTRTP